MLPNPSANQNTEARAVVLTIGDDARTQQMVSRLARPMSFFVEHCSSMDELLPCQSRATVACVIVSCSPNDAEGLSRLRPLFERQCGSPVIVTATRPTTAMVVQAIRQGAFDVLESPVDEISLRRTLAGAMELAQVFHQGRELVADFHRRLALLSEGDRDVLEAIYAGQLNKQIASDLGVSIRTVEQRRRRVFRQMDVASAAPLARHIATARTTERIHRDSRNA